MPDPEPVNPDPVPAPGPNDDPKPDDPKPDEPKPDEPKPDEPKPDEPKPDEPKPDDPKPDEPKPDEPKPDDPKPDEPKPEVNKNLTPRSKNKPVKNKNLPPDWASKTTEEKLNELKNYKLQGEDITLEVVYNRGAILSNLFFIAERSLDILESKQKDRADLAKVWKNLKNAARSAVISFKNSLILDCMDIVECGSYREHAIQMKLPPITPEEPDPAKELADAAARAAAKLSAYQAAGVDATSAYWDILVKVMEILLTRFPAIKTRPTGWVVSWSQCFEAFMAALKGFFSEYLKKPVKPVPDGKEGEARGEELKTHLLAQENGVHALLKWDNDTSKQQPVDDVWSWVYRLEIPSTWQQNPVMDLEEVDVEESMIGLLPPIPTKLFV